MTIKMEQIMAVILSRDLRRGIFNPVVFNNSRKLRIKFNRCVSIKLMKYPVMPKGGRSKYRKTISRKEVRML